MDLITNPNKFFEARKEKDPNLLTPILTIILPTAIVAGVHQYFLASKLSEAFTGEFAYIFKISAYLGVVLAFIGSFIVWLILSLIMFGISAAFGGEGSFKRTMEFTGYGFLPFLVGSVVTTPISVKYVIEAEVPKVTLEMIKRNPDLMSAILKAIIPAEVVYANAIVHAATVVWAVVIWSFAIKHARNLEFTKAFISALIPSGLYGAYQLWSLLKLL